MLAHNHSREPVGIHTGLSFIVGDLIKSTKHLPEWLPDTSGEQVFAPKRNLGTIERKRMPQPDVGGRAQIELLPAGVAQIAPKIDSRASPPLIVTEYPNEPAAEKPEERMFDEVLTPVVESHAARCHERRLQTKSLGEIGLFQLFDER